MLDLLAETAGFSEMGVNIDQVTRRLVREDHDLQPGNRSKLLHVSTHYSRSDDCYVVEK